MMLSIRGLYQILAYVYEICIGTWQLQRYFVYAAPPKEGFLSASLADRL